MSAHQLGPSHIDGEAFAVGAGWVGTCSTCAASTGDTGGNMRAAVPRDRDETIELLRWHVAVAHGVDRANLRLRGPA